jgi:lambda family phage minor tail protein L
MSNDIITTDLQSQSVDSGFIELYELDLGNGTTLYFHPGLEENLTPIQYDGNEYIALPIMMDGIDVASDGASNRPSLTVANVTNVFRSALSNSNFSFEDLTGCRITRRQTFEKYLDTAAFEMPRRVYIIDRIASENNVSVSFELVAPFDVSGVRVPNRVVVGKYCSWLYQGYESSNKGGCSWKLSNQYSFNGTTYTAYFDLDDRPLIESGVVTFSAWVEGTYGQDEFVTYNNRKWRSQVTGNTVTPGVGEFWKEVFEWTEWSFVTTYSVGDYVKYNNVIWKCITANTTEIPFTGSVYWKRVDFCGKTLNSCKSRFQCVPTADGVPSARVDTQGILPFGAFPGSVKFK